MKITGILLAMLAAPICASAQHLGFTQSELLSREQMKISTGNIDNQYGDVKGTAFFSEAWLPATASTAKGAQYAGLKMKYDIYKNKIFTNVHDTIYDMSETGIIRFTLYPETSDTTLRHVFQKGYTAGTVRSDQFVEVLAAGKLIFFKQHTLEIKEVNEDSPLDKVKKFIGQDYYYLLTANDQGAVVRLNKKTLEKEMAAKWNEVTKFAKEKDTSFTDESGWSLLVNFYNSLP
jgi:hypothetical protein